MSWTVRWSRSASGAGSDSRSPRAFGRVAPHHRPFGARLSAVSNAPSSKPSLLAALALVAVGVILGIAKFRLVGGIIAGAGVIPSCYAAWQGMQQETQRGLAGALGMVFLSLGAAVILVVWAIVGGVGSLF